MRKIIFLIVIANGLGGIAFGQGFIRMNFSQPAALVAQAGHDTLVCLNHPVILGGTPSATGGSYAYAYLWEPAEGLNDPTSANPTATLSESKTYTLSVFDSQGCTAKSTINVRVDACMGTSDQILNQKITVYPNPSNGVFTIQGLNFINDQVHSLDVYNHLGQNLLSQRYRNGECPSDIMLDTRIQEPGVYFLKITLSSTVISKRLIVR